VGSLRSYIEAFDGRLGQLNTVAPKVSIIVTNYNYVDYIVECLQSVSQQIYPEIECIVVDDHSSDGSTAQISRFIESDRSSISFKLVCHEKARGQYAAFRTGMAHISGAFVVFLDADDLLLPDFVSEHVRVHLSMPPVAFTSSNQYQIDSLGQVIGGVHPDLLTQDRFRMIGTVSLHRSFWVWATTSSMMFRRAVLGYALADADEAFRKCADNYVAHFCNLLGGSILIPTRLGCYRRHQRNTFSNNPLIGGRLPTGDMRHHPTHRIVLDSIRTRLIERHEEFISLLGPAGFVHTVARVTPGSELLRNRRDLTQVVGVAGLTTFVSMVGLNVLRAINRRLRNRPAAYTVTDLEGSNRGAKIASYADYQRHRRDAK